MTKEYTLKQLNEWYLVTLYKMKLIYGIWSKTAYSRHELRLLRKYKYDLEFINAKLREKHIEYYKS